MQPNVKNKSWIVLCSAFFLVCNKFYNLVNQAVSEARHKTRMLLKEEIAYYFLFRKDLVKFGNTHLLSKQ